jgi:hypothetical protein
MTMTHGPTDTAYDTGVCEAIEHEVLRLSTAVVDAAHAPARKDPDPVGHSPGPIGIARAGGALDLVHGSPAR